MSSISKKETKTGNVYYEIRCHVDRNRPTLTKRWYPPDGWSKKSIDRELSKVAAEFELQCKNGEVLSRAERAAKAAEEEEAASKILTLRQYAEKTYLPAKEVACSGTTVASFRGNLRNYITPPRKFAISWSAFGRNR